MKRALLCWLAACFPAFGGLTFEHPSQEVKTDVDAQSVTVEYAFSNDSDTPVKVDSLDTGCPCMTVSVKGGKLYYKPGEKGVLQAVVDLSGFYGRVEKDIKILTDGAQGNQLATVVKLAVNIPVLVDIQPRTLVWDQSAPAEAKTVTITVTGDDPVRLLSVSDGSGKFEKTLKTVEEGRKYELSISPANTQRPDMMAFRIETDSPAKRYKVQNIFAVVRPKGASEVHADGSVTPEAEASRAARLRRSMEPPTAPPVTPR